MSPCSTSEVPRRVEVAVVTVFVGNHDRLSRPMDGESRVVPAYAALAFRGVKLIDQVEGLGVVGQSDKSVRKALGDVHHAAVFSRQVGTEALAKVEPSPRADQG